ncbi:hypothetical protein [[Clostridium] fimetarium]|nr:hypothetical protein [[Clostridium] fimetarium]
MRKSQKVIKKHKISIIGMLVIVIGIIVALSTNVSALASIMPNELKEFIYYTKEPESISINLDNPVKNENVVYFTKEIDNTYTYFETKEIVNGATAFDITPIMDWTEYTENRVYIAITDKTENELQSFTGKNDSDESTTDKINLVDGNGNILEIQVITIIYEDDAPTFAVAKDIDTWTKEVTLTVTATDALDLIKVGSGLNKKAYSFNDGLDWQEFNSKSFADNQTVKIKVRDVLENTLLTAQEIVINKIDKTAPTLVKVSSTYVLSEPTNQSNLWYKSATITVEGAADTESGLNTTAYSFDGGVKWQSGATFTTSQNGTYDIQVRDALDNVFKTSIITSGIDSAPIINIKEESIKEWVKDTSTFEFSIEDVGTGYTLSDITGSVTGGNVVVSNIAANKYLATITLLNGGSKVLDQPVKISIKDKAGNPAQETTIKNIKIDSTPPTIKIDEASISSDWSGKLASFDFSVTDDESGVASDSIKILVPNGTVEITESGNHYTAKITAVDGKIIDQKIEISAQDQVQNAIKVTTIKSIKLDDSRPQIVILESTISAAWSKTATFDFTVKDTGSLVDIKKIKATVENGQVVITEKPDVENTYTATITANEDSIVNNSVTITAKDGVGNLFDFTTVKPVKADNQISEISNIKVEKTSGSNDKTVVKNGDVITVSFNLSDDNGSGINNSAVKVYFNGSVAKIAELTNGVYHCSFIVDSDFVGMEDTALFITKIEYLDIVGNNSIPQQYEGTGIKYYTPINSGFSDFTFKSENSVTNLVKDGEKVYVSFYTTHPVSLQQAFIYQTAPSDIVWTTQNDSTKMNGKYYFEGYYTTVNDENFDNTNLKLKLVITDNAKNVEVIKTQAEAVDIKYYAPIDAGISGLSFTSNNKKTSNAYAKDGDVLTVAFKTTHPVHISKTTIAGKDITFSSEDGMNWIGTYTVVNGVIPDNSDINFDIELYDDSQNNKARKSQNDTTKIRYQAPIVINDLTMISDNTSNLNLLAKNGNIITAKFSTTHPVIVTGAKIANKDISFNSNDGMNWTALYRVEDGDTSDNADIALLINTDDLVGNTSLVLTQENLTTEKIKYYAPLVVSDLIITTNNEKDTTKNVKDGDKITIRFTTNHDATISNASISDNTSEISNVAAEGIKRDWELSYTIQNADVPDLSYITFAFKVNDIAGNNTLNKTEASDVTNLIQYFAPITADTSIESNYKNTGFAKNGDVVTVKSKANHDVIIESSQIFDRTTTNVGLGGMDLVMEYQFLVGENNLTEGMISFDYVLIDTAGNKLIVDETDSKLLTKVIYDHTNPIVSVVPESISFTNELITYNIYFKDEYLVGEDISVLVNGAEYMTNDDRQSVTGTEFTKSVTLKADGNYTISASLLDKAGNSSNPNAETSVTVDTTIPEIKAVNIVIGSPKTFKAGFVISDYFDFIDLNLKEIICTVSNKDGTNVWNVSDPITTEGKQTLYLMVRDMADNTSMAVTYDFYIDGTPPKSIVKEINTSKVLVEGQNLDPFISKMTLSIGLESLQTLNNNELDKFTVLKLVDQNGNVVIDLLNELDADINGTYSYSMKEYGSYKLLAQAVDAVGNETEVIEYNYEFKDKSILLKYYENTPLFASSLAVVGVLAVLGVASIISIKKRKKLR